MIISKSFLTFIIVGAITALIDIGLMQLLIWVGVYYLVAATLGFFVGLLANFSLHTRVTFGAEYSHSVLVRFVTVVFINYFTTLLIVHLFQITLNEPLLGKLISLPVVAVNGFFLSKNWVYK
ncbi:GtrA family protein [Herbaspirillum sp. B65]|uniref:GtrA family protein n=1 Tax=Herbaspirillum sp. B65 TaxID=137708 RepID=UPI000679B781|nr:GtrA family protein [Herbaspirillum sp. B65]